MKKRILSLLLVMAMLITLLPQLTIKADAHQIVMTANKFIECLWTAYNRPNYYYNSFPYNLGYYDGSRISFDCWNLGKAIIWSKGAIVNNYTKGTYAPMDSSCGLGDWDGLTIVREAPNCSSDFSNLVPGEWLYMDNHTGYYVGDGQVIECTAGWNVWAITVSQIDRYGNRSRNGVGGGSWKLHGMVPWLDYTNAGKQETWVEKAAFDPMVYRDRYEDLKDMTDAQLKDHWLKFGIKEGRCASVVLDLKYYVENNPDVKKSVGNDYVAAYQHFIKSGYHEPRKTSPLFDGKYYCDNNPDVVANFKENFLLHYINYGMKEGRRASQTFDVNYYLFLRPDVAKTWPGDLVTATKHYAGHGIREGRAGYDSENPVISNVTVSNVTASGYTVTCKVTDNWGIEKVAFPSWTADDGQDDLPSNWSSTALGTKNGDTYTYQVKTSDHSYITGLYITHIYATDLGGNTISVSVPDVDVKDPVKKITLLSGSPKTIDGIYLNVVKAGTNVKALLEEFENEVLEVKSSKGNVISGTAIVGTGSTVNLYDGSELVDSVTVVVLGDVDGNGSIDTTDYMRIKSGFLNSFELNEAQQMAADVDRSGGIDATDYMRIKSQILGQFDLHNA